MKFREFVTQEGVKVGKKYLPFMGVSVLLVIIVVAIVVCLIRAAKETERKIEETKATLKKVADLAPLAINDKANELWARLPEELKTDAWGNKIEIHYVIGNFKTTFMAHSHGPDEKHNTDDDICITREKRHIAHGVGKTTTSGIIQSLKGAVDGAKNEFKGD